MRGLLEHGLVEVSTHRRIVRALGPPIICDLSGVGKGKYFDGREGDSDLVGFRLKHISCKQQFLRCAQTGRYRLFPSSVSVKLGHLAG